MYEPAQTNKKLIEWSDCVKKMKKVWKENKFKVIKGEIPSREAQSNNMHITPQQ